MYRNKSICVIMPAFNEEATICDTIDALPEYVDHVIVVDDGSRDQTAHIAEKKGAAVFKHRQNRGVGATFNTGLRAALNYGADIVVNMDADGQFNPQDTKKLITPIIEGRAQFVTASRFLDPLRTPAMSRVKRWGNKCMSLMVSTIAKQRFYDVSCGFRAYSKEALAQLNLFGDFTYTQESFLNFAFKNIAILEVPVDVTGERRYGKSRVASNLLKYAYHTFIIIIKTVRDYKPFHMFTAIAIFFLTIALALAAFLAVHYVKTSKFTPHKWAGFTSGFFIILATLSFALGFILDIFARMRLNQERILFFLKRQIK